jgi:transcriptional regulator with XRE-family HTH domain
LSLGEKIREARGALKQRELADMLGVDPITVSRWERGAVEPSGKRIRQIAEATGRTAEWFYVDEPKAAVA